MALARIVRNAAQHVLGSAPWRVKLACQKWSN